MVSNDPIFDIRSAIAKALRLLKVSGDHKRITDASVDSLPDFFRSPLRQCSVDGWMSLHEFDAIPGDVVLRRWKSRETGEYQYSLISSWKGKADYFPGSEFLMVDDRSDAEASCESMEYWSR